MDSRRRRASAVSDVLVLLDEIDRDPTGHLLGLSRRLLN